MGRIVSWFSCGAASAVATMLSSPDVIAYCETGSEDIDNERFMIDCEAWFGRKITKLRNDKFVDTWDVWETKRYISGIHGAPCAGALKIEPRLAFEQPDDIHIFGYTADSNDMKRADALRETWPHLHIETPLIDRGITKAACLALVISVGILLPRTYAWGFPNANCIPCCKATSPAYWALVRKFYPVLFWRMATLSRELGARLSRINNERIFIDEIPDDFPVTEAIAPECDFLCQMAEIEFARAA